MTVTAARMASSAPKQSTPNFILVGAVLERSMKHANVRYHFPATPCKNVSGSHAVTKDKSPAKSVICCFWFSMTTSGSGETEEPPHAKAPAPPDDERSSKSHTPKNVSF